MDYYQKEVVEAIVKDLDEAAEAKNEISTYVQECASATGWDATSVAEGDPKHVMSIISVLNRFMKFECFKNTEHLLKWFNLRDGT